MPRRGLGLRLWLVVLSGGAMPCVAAGGAGREPDAEQIARTGRATAGLLASSRASWRVGLRAESGATVYADVLWTPRMSRWRFRLEAGPRKADLFGLITRPDGWYATQAGKPLGKFRPYETPFAVPGAYLLFRLAEARFVTSASMLDGARHVRSDDAGARFRLPLSDDDARKHTQAIRQLEMLVRGTPDAARQAAARRQIQKLRERLEGGLLLGIDPATGLLLQRSEGTYTIVLKDFQWLQRVEDKAFHVADVTWKDHTADPTQGVDANDLAMIGHGGVPRPGLEPGQPDCCLMNVRTGRFRRVPFGGASCGDACFLKDRKRVVVCGGDGIRASNQLVEVDLRTGRNRRLGGGSLYGGYCGEPALSPDGKTLAVLHSSAAGGSAQFGPQGEPPKAQVCLLDLAAGRARKVGPPLFAACMSWLPDGSGLVLMTWKGKPVQAGKPQPPIIARMDLDGKVTPIRKGGWPVVLASGKMLFSDWDERRAWKMCDLGGKVVRKLAKSFQPFLRPSPSPGGKRLLWVQVRRGAPPLPMVTDLAGGRSTVVTRAAGSWGPAWWR